MPPAHIGTTNAGQARDGAGGSICSKSKIVDAEVPLVRLVNMLKGTPPKWGLQLEPDQVGKPACMHHSAFRGACPQTESQCGRVSLLHVMVVPKGESFRCLHSGAATGVRTASYVPALLLSSAMSQPGLPLCCHELHCTVSRGQAHQQGLHRQQSAVQATLCTAET